jgi:RNA polymerase sigma factor (sigma-70 family)
VTYQPLNSIQKGLLSTYERYRADLEAYFSSRWPMEHVSPEDLVQKVYLRLCTEDLSDIQDPRAFIFYLAGFVARNEVVARKQARITVSLDGGIADEPELFEDRINVPPDNSLRNVERAELNRHIGTLAPHLTIVVRLHYLNGLTIPQISKMTGLKRDAIKKRLRKAIITLRKLYGVGVLRNQ